MASTPLLHLSLHRPQILTTKSYHRPSSKITALLRHPLRSTVKIPQPPPPHCRPRPSLTISASYTPTPVTDRLISAAAYFLPFLNGLQYGRFLFAQYPTLALALEPILPLLRLYSSMPYASFVAFFGLYLGVVRNAALSRYVRFNAMQAVVLDVLLVLPMLLLKIFSPGRTGIGFKLMVMGHNAVFVFIVFCFVYSLVCSVLGRTPHLPFVADAAGRQL
ncbi:protein TIC 20-II, chloroplastic-like [Cornus florida]|uniref:protein TIC 20-II, chloroplastic-like n=1 Tax=Cornus florida TaxID=4283 RepID=UPI00289CB0D5|nr:protein TIC 20-II, chloroplastic-like [Cornus florida]